MTQVADSHIHVVAVSLNVQLTIPDALFKQFVPASVQGLGMRVAEQVFEYCKKNNLNYFPALDFIVQQHAIDAYLLDAVEETSNIALEICMREVKNLLTPVYSNVTVETAQCLAYAMPSCRPGDSDALNRLAAHYAPRVIKLQLHLSSLHRQLPQKGMERYVSDTVFRWLEEVFIDPAITAVRILPDN